MQPLAIPLPNTVSFRAASLWKERKIVGEWKKRGKSLALNHSRSPARTLYSTLFPIALLHY